MHLQFPFFFLTLYSHVTSPLHYTLLLHFLICSYPIFYATVDFNVPATDMMLQGTNSCVCHTFTAFREGYRNINFCIILTKITYREACNASSPHYLYKRITAIHKTINYSPLGVVSLQMTGNMLLLLLLLL